MAFSDKDKIEIMKLAVEFATYTFSQEKDSVTDVVNAYTKMVEALEKK